MGSTPRPKNAVLDREPHRFEVVVARYLEHLSKAVNGAGKPRAASYQHATKRYLTIPAWAGRDVRSIQRADAIEVLDRDEGPSGNRALSALRALFAWAVQKGLVETSPLAGIKPGVSEISRDRALIDAELRVVLKASEGFGTYQEAFVKALILLGQRRGETAGMKRADLDIGEAIWTIAAADNKARRAHVVPLPPLAMDLISRCHPIGTGRFVFGAREIVNFSDLKERLDALCEQAADELGLSRVAPWHWHDLRRTAATGLSRLRVPRFTIERILNHSDGVVTGRYDRYDHLDPKREAIATWAGMFKR